MVEHKGGAGSIPGGRTKLLSISRRVRRSRQIAMVKARGADSGCWNTEKSINLWKQTPT